MGKAHSPASYRSIATRVSYRWPVLTALGTQINFWIITNVMLATINWTVMYAAQISYGHVGPAPFVPICLMAAAAGIVYGSLLGIIDLLLDRHPRWQGSLGRRILLRAVFYTLIFIATAALIILSFERMLVDTGIVGLPYALTPEIRFRWALTFVPTTVVGNFLISFIRQTNRSFGPGLLINLLLGRYREPVKEQRIFLFMDLKGSTTHAEELGPERYSAMIRDLFHDVDSVVPRFEAEIHQYVGDEVVFTWHAPGLRDKRRCLLFFFAMQDAIAAHRERYERVYGRFPSFKAGLHVGDVIAVEIGEIKREIAYHGDPINTAARIQSMSNKFGEPLLISEDLLQLCGDLAEKGLRSKPLGPVALRGKQAELRIHAIERITQWIPLPMTDEPTQAADPEKQARKAAKKAEKEKRNKVQETERGVETLFRVTLNNHTRLSQIADNKANIMLTVNALMISLLISGPMTRVDKHPEYMQPIALLLLTCVLSIITATLATRPKITAGRSTARQMKDKTANLLFFGNFHDMPLDEYQKGMNEVMADRDYLYGSLTRDLHALGTVLHRKYKYLRITYTIFMFGVTSTVLLIVGSTLAEVLPWFF